MFILITPAPNTSRAMHGKVMSGGRHYILVERTDVLVRNALAQGTMVSLEGFEHKGAFIARADIDNLVRELGRTRKQEEGETYEEYRGNLYRFAVESLASEQEDEGNAEDEKPTQKKRAPSKSAKASDPAPAADPSTEG